MTEDAKGYGTEKRDNAESSETISLIMSGAYVGQELAAEFGHLPPTFLPLGTKRLYEFQRPLFSGSGPVYLALPESFSIPPTDFDRITALGLSPLLLPDDLSLGEAVVFSLNLIAGPTRPVLMLHGDTLVESMPPIGSNNIGAAYGSEGYSWAEIELVGDRVSYIETIDAGLAREQKRPIACGTFSFADNTALVRAITRARGDFITGIKLYAIEHKLQIEYTNSWYDFGHVQTFFRSRRIITSARSFNAVHIDGRIARKLSNDETKMKAEANWLSSVPPEVKIYSARLMRQGKTLKGQYFYETEYAYLPTLSELFVFGTLGRAAWARILESCREFLVAGADTKELPLNPGTGDEVLAQLVMQKTKERLKQFANESKFPINSTLQFDGVPVPSLMEISDRLADHIDFKSNRSATIMHGDFCFSNILYDSRVQRIKVIDPRGFVEPTTPNIYGDLRYDMAKLAHSILGRYDQIIAGRYSISQDDNLNFSLKFENALHNLWLEDAANQFIVDDICLGSREIHAIMIGLFLSMLPLHADRPDRQIAFTANALRLYTALQKA